MEEAVQKRAPEPPSVDSVAAKLVDAPFSTVPVTEFLEQKVEKNSLDKKKMKRRFAKLT